HGRLAPFAQAFQHFEPFKIGQAEIEKNHIGSTSGDFHQSLLAGFGLKHLIILALEHDSQEPANLHFVVDDERDRLHFAAGTPATTESVASLGNRICSCNGSRMENRAPPFSRFCATISPPCASTSWRAMERPRPIP